MHSHTVAKFLLRFGCNASNNTSTYFFMVMFANITVQVMRVLFTKLRKRHCIYFWSIYQSISRGICWGTCHRVHSTMPRQGKSSCRSPSHPKYLMEGSINFLKPWTLWPCPWPPPLKVVSYRNNLVSRINFWVGSHMAVHLE